MAQEKKVTINEIAKLAQVSKGTVSKVLNHKPGIGKETRQRVMELVSHLGYHPSSVAQALANKKTNNIGLIFPHETGQSLNGAYWSALITSITQRAAVDKYNLMLFTPPKEGELAEMYDSVLLSRRVDGLIIGAEMLDKLSLAQLEDTGMPFILIGRSPDFHHHSVDVNNRFAVRSMTEHMIRHGYKKIGFLAGPRRYYYNQERIQAFKETMREHGLVPCLSEADEYNRELTFEAVDSLMESFPDLEGIFIGAGGEFLYDVLNRIKYLGINTKTLGMSVFDDYRYLDFMEPRLTAIKQPLEEMGAMATESLMKLIAGEEVEEIQYTLPATITVRGSCSEKMS